MRQFQPISFDHLPFSVEVTQRNLWNNATRVFETVNVETVDTAQDVRFRISAIHMQHEEGKLWQSIFVPVTPDGREGFSITWWGKDLNVKGQSQVKRVKEEAWYDTVKSKCVKGYTAVDYSGRVRTEIIKVGHEFVDSLVRQAEVQGSFSPCAALERTQSENIIRNSTMEGVGHAVGIGLESIHATASILWKVRQGGVDLPNAIYNEFKSSTLHNPFNDGLTRALADGVTIPSAQPNKTPAPKIDRAEVYGDGWGFFG